MWLFKKELRWRTIQAILIILIVISSFVFHWDTSIIGSSIGVALMYTIILLCDGCSKKRYLKRKEEYEEAHSDFSCDCRMKAAYYAFYVTVTAEIIGFFILAILGEKEISIILGCIYLVQVVLFECLYSFFKWNDSW